MNKLKMSVCAVIAYVVLVVGFGIAASPSATGQGQGHPPSRDVRVINSASESVPVSGQVAVSSLPAVQLDTSNPLPVVDAANPTREPFQIAVSVSGNSNFGVASFTVPAGKRLVIEYISAAMYNNGSGVVMVGPAPLSSAPSVAVPFGDSIRGAATGGKEVLFYGNPGQTLQVRVDFYTVGVFGGEVTIVGHLVEDLQ